jgi:hypothetical protein
MSIDYQSQGDAMNLANQMQAEYELDNPTVVDAPIELDTDTGEVTEV